MENGTYRIEIEGQDGQIRKYLVDADTLISLKEREINYTIIIEG